MSRIRGRGALEEVGGRSFHGGLTCKQAGASGTCREERGAWAAVDSGRRELVVVGKTPPGCLKAAGVVDAPKGDSQAPCPSPHATSYSLRPLQHPLPHGGGPDPGEPPPRALRKVGPRSPRPTEPAPGPIQPEPGRRGRGGPSAPEQHAQAPATCREAPRAGLSPPAGVPAPLHPPPPRVPQAPTYRLGPAGERARAGAPGDSVFRPGRKVCAMQRGRRGGRRGRQGVGAGRAARRARASVPPASGACVLPESPRPPRSRSRRPEPGALRPQPRRAPVAAARPPPILPLPLNSRATDAERHLRGSRRRAPRPPRAPSPRPSAGAPTTPRAPHRAPTIRAPRQPRPRDPRSPRAPAIRAAHGRRSHRPSPRLRSEPRGSPAPLLDPW
uniref:Uncharacterized protein n=1 Tax=Rangifer tarandus platyrhynchus TaxID=3082113 RepID=A0ACB0F8I9_RANTA|nr:unnamed protein product [Rangifer tarandus platyrhynchus]